MARLKTHYDNLQITRNASPEVVRAAYRGLSQKWHPDRNPPDKRQECERVMKIINAAYETLSDPELRARHDRWIAEQERPEPGRPQPQGGVPEPAGFDFSDSRLQPGTIRWADTRDAARAEITLAFGNSQPGYACAPIARLSTQVCISASGIAMVSAVWAWSTRMPLSGQLAVFAYFAVLAACLLIVYGLLRSYQMLASGFGRRIAVTPTHLVECDYATMTVWPLLGARRFDATHHHLNGAYSGTDVHFEHIAGGSRNFMLRSKSAADRLKGTLADNISRAQKYGVAYLGEIKNSALYWQPKGKLEYAHNGAPAIGVSVALGGLLLSLVVFFAVIQPPSLPVPAPPRPAAAQPAASEPGSQPQSRAEAPPTQTPAQVSASGEPATGWVQRPSRNPAVALSISAPAPGSYYVKLLYTDEAPLGTLYLRGGETLRVYVPVGIYRVRYAYGDSWLGTDRLFGDDTFYAELRDNYDFFVDQGRPSSHDIVIYGRLAGSSQERVLTAAQW
ncbi:MAG: DnaJ domain-containing protein [Nevskia sp.]|nr:DnaJ domain-containing protein [Nevskia sp.]